MFDERLHQFAQRDQAAQTRECKRVAHKGHMLLPSMRRRMNACMHNQLSLARALAIDAYADVCAVKALAYAASPHADASQEGTTLCPQVCVRSRIKKLFNVVCPGIVSPLRVHAQPYNQLLSFLPSLSVCFDYYNSGALILPRSDPAVSVT
eukprot:3695537-Pleurochrysis_carterae.AAC.1